MKFFTKNHIKYGLMMSGLIVLCLLVMEVTGDSLSFDNKSPFQMIFMMLAPFVVWYWGINARKIELKGKLSFKDGLTEGFKISLIYAIVSPFIFMIYNLFINPEIVEFMRTTYGLTGASDGMVVGFDMIVQFVIATVFGTLYGAILSFFLKTKS